MKEVLFISHIVFFLNNVLQAGLEELLPHEGNLSVVSSYTTENLLSFIFKIFILYAVRRK
jgi:hypothetical protein